MKAHVILPNNKGKVNGGGKVLIRMAQTLQELGYETTIEFSNGEQPKWLDIKVPIYSVKKADLVVVCEISFGWINRVHGFNVVYYQSPTYIERDRNLKPISYKQQGAQGVIFNSEWNRQRYLKELPDEDGPVVHPTVDVNTFYPAEKIDFKQGIYFPRKNYGLAVRVINQLKSKGININWIKADEMSENDLAKIWRGLGLTMITGYPESFPMPPLEAMASGSVPIGTSGGAGKEYMKHGYNSLVTKDGDWEELAEAIQRVFYDEKLFLKLRENAIQTAKQYTQENQKQELIQAFKYLQVPNNF